MRPTMNSLFHWHLRALFLVGPLVAANSANAQDIAAAEALYNTGFADMQAGRYETGCKALAESQRLDPRMGTLFTLATCEAEWGRIATAVTRFGDYLALYDRLPDDRKTAQAERRKVAAETRDKLIPDVPQLALSLPKEAPVGTLVKRDGDMVAAAALGLSLPVDPGDHTVSTQPPGGPIWEQRLTIAKGEKKRVTLQVKAAKVEPPLRASGTATAPGVEPVSPGLSGQRVAAYMVGGVGLAGLIGGGVLGGLAAGQKGVVDEHCGAGIGSSDETACDQTGLDAASSFKGFGLGSTIGLAVGGVALGTALVLFLAEPKAAESTEANIATGTRGGWISAGVLSIGPARAMLGAQGAW